MKRYLPVLLSMALLLSLIAGITFASDPIEVDYLDIQFGQITQDQDIINADELVLDGITYKAALVNIKDNEDQIKGTAILLQDISNKSTEVFIQEEKVDEWKELLENSQSTDDIEAVNKRTLSIYKLYRISDMLVEQSLSEVIFERKSDATSQDYYLAHAVLSTAQNPIIHFFTVNQSSDNPVVVTEGEVNYALLVESFSANKKVKVSIQLKNEGTGEQKSVLKDSWQDSAPRADKFSLTNGNWSATVTAIDEDGRAAEPFSVSIVVGGVLNLKVYKVTPTPILIKQDLQNVKVTVTLENSDAIQQVSQVAWKWSGDLSWATVQDVTIPSKYINTGRADVTFSIPVQMNGSKRRDIVFSVNPNKNPVENEYSDNETTVSVEYEYANLRVRNMILKKVEKDAVYVDIFFDQEQLEGRTETITSDVIFGPSSDDMPISISLPPGVEQRLPNQKLIRSGDKVQAYAEINPSRTKPINEMIEKDNKRNVTFNFEQSINLYTSFVSGGTYREGDTVDTLVKVGNIENSVMGKPVDVVLRRNGAEIGRQSVIMNPGEERTLLFQWKAPNTSATGPKYYEMEAEINPEPRKLIEITYADNIARNTVTVLPIYNPQKCDSSYAGAQQAVSGYYEEWDCSGTPSVCRIVVLPYYETVSMTQTQPVPNKVKAGMGFYYEVDTVYQNDNPNNGNNHGFKEVTSEFPEGQKIDLVPTTPVPGTTTKWLHPRAKISRGQGDLEMIEYVPEIEPISVDPKEAIDGGNKHYTSFYFEDGPYTYITYAEGAGVNTITYTDIKGDTNMNYRRISPRLKACISNFVDIKGSPHEDYVFRRIDPNMPFPQGGLHGWNWDGLGGIFDELAPWFNSYGQENPEGADIENNIYNINKGKSN